MAEATTQNNNNTSSWQDSVPQQYRSDEISKIATELAKLEPSATMQSKLGLASRFEQLIFGSSTSINDYHKKIQKRLKKLKKNYEATHAAASGGTAGGAAAGSGVVKGSIEEEIVMKKRNLRMLFGDTMLLIAQNAKIAAAGYPRLIDHIDKSNEYAFEIGAIPKELAVSIASGKPIVLPKRSEKETLDYLKLLENSLDQKISTLREWILKYSQEEKFFGEKLEQMEKNILLNTEKDYARIFYNGLVAALQQEGISDLTNLTTPDLIQGIKNYQKQMKETIPIPRNREDEKSASLAYINKIRAASQLCLFYILLRPEDQNLKLEFAGSLHSANNVIFEVLKLLKETYKESEEENGSDTNGSTSTHDVKLEDVWNKVLEYDNPEEQNISSSVINIDDDDGDDEETASEPNKKRLKMSSGRKREGKPLAIRAKILLIGGRKPTSNLVDALKRKRAVLCQSPASAHLKLDFGKAFEMLIYLSPLLVRIRALPPEKQQQQQQNYNTQYNVMSVSGNVNLVGPLISKRLEYASAQATKCLRRCFADLAYRTNRSDFETEILEGMALLKFLNLVRNTYCANWVDADLD